MYSLRSISRKSHKFSKKNDLPTNRVELLDIELDDIPEYILHDPHELSDDLENDLKFLIKLKKEEKKNPSLSKEQKKKARKQLIAKYKVKNNIKLTSDEQEDNAIITQTMMDTVHEDFQSNNDIRRRLNILNYEPRARGQKRGSRRGSRRRKKLT
jgi:hypothetical protein